MSPWMVIGAVFLVSTVPAEGSDRNFYGILATAAMILAMAIRDHFAAGRVKSDLERATAKAEKVAQIVKEETEKLEALMLKHEENAVARGKTLKSKVAKVENKVKENTAVTVLKGCPEEELTPEQKRMLDAMKAQVLAGADPQPDPNALPRTPNQSGTLAASRGSQRAE